MKLSEVARRNFSFYSEDYIHFIKEKSQCRKCDIYDNYEQVLQSEGNARDPIFMFIGEAPGADEIKEIRPFVGKAGQELRRVLRIHKNIFNRKTSIITNIISCRPRGNKFPASPDRADERVKTCIENWLLREIQILKPAILITLGSQALWYVRRQLGISSKHGTWLESKALNAWTFATFHPSYVIRCSNDKNKKHIVQWFEQDFEKLSSTWKSFAVLKKSSEEVEIPDLYDPCINENI